MEKIDMEQASLQEILQAIDYCNTTYGKEYNIYTYYHYNNDNIVGIVYGWFMNNDLFIDIVFIKSEYRGKGILLLSWCNIKENIYLPIFLLVLAFLFLFLITYKIDTYIVSH